MIRKASQTASSEAADMLATVLLNRSRTSAFSLRSAGIERRRIGGSRLSDVFGRHFGLSAFEGVLNAFELEFEHFAHVLLGHVSRERLRRGVKVVV